MAKKIKMNDEIYVGNSNVQIKDLLGTLLWANPNPSQDFTGQSINISSINDYDVIEIYYRLWGSAENVVSTKFVKSTQGCLTGTFAYSDSVIRLVSRKVKIENSNVLFEGARNITGFSQSIVNNSVAIPIYIIGYNTGLFTNE